MTKEQWQAIKKRDPAWDGAIYCGLIASKTLCRVSCGRRARDVRNVTVFSSVDEALADGYLPCRYCRPDRDQTPRQELVQAAKAYLRDHCTEKFSLAVLAGELYVNGSYLLRAFKAATGTTLLAYHQMLRCERAKELLTHNEFTIAAVGDLAGFATPAHFSRIFKKCVGMTPTQFRNAYDRELDAD